MNIIQPGIIGLSGYGRSGKDTSLELLNESLMESGLVTYQKMSLADAVKSDLAFCIKRAEALYFKDRDRNSERAKDSFKQMLRPLFETYATDLIRGLDKNAWIDLAEMSMKYIEASSDTQLRWAFTDVRYGNEFAHIHDRGGAVFLIVRPGEGPKGEREQQGAEEIRKLVNKNEKMRESLIVVINNGDKKKLKKKLFEEYLNRFGKCNG